LDVHDGVAEYGVFEVPVAHRVRLPGIEARRGHLHHPTAGRHGQVRAGLGDEDVRHFGRTWSLAKYAAARLRISTSIFAVRSSRRRATNSARPSVLSPPRCPSSMSACFTQLRRQESEMPRSSAIWAMGLSPSRASSM